MAWQDFRDSAYTRADDIEAAGSSLHYNCPECLRQRRVKVDVTTNHYIANLFVSHSSPHLDPILKHVLFPHLDDVYHFGSVSGQDESHSRVRFAYPRDACHEQVGTLIVEEAADDDYDNTVR